MFKAVVATKNAHKVRELEALFAPFGEISLVTAKEMGFDKEIEENGTTFSENAYIKAFETAKELGIPAFADDSGLCVDVLDGAPGIYSARYASKDGEGNSTDEQNNQKLLNDLKDVPMEKRTAHYVCAMCLCFPDGRHIDSVGKCYGQILFEQRGNGGFGYDSMFYCPEHKKTYAEITAQEKNRISHRAKAVELICKQMKEQGII